MTRTLLILRHAKAAQVLGLADHERPLAERGRSDSIATGDYLRKHGLLPDLVLCSTSLRTRQTLEGLAIDAPVSYERIIYRNDVDDLLTLVQATGDEVGTLLLIGHNPAFHELAIELSGEQIDYFPTSALAVIELASWADGHGRLVSHRTPKTG